MVFVLEDIAKIETDRMAARGVVENFTYVQPSDSIRKDPRTLDKISQIIEHYVAARRHYVWSQDTIGVLGVFADAFLNAGWWGNRDVPGKIIQVCIKYGVYGSVIYVEDEGIGFDYRTQINKLQRGEQHDFTNNGGGLRKFHASLLHVAYHGSGNKISIATRVFTDDEILSFLSSKRQN